MSPITSLYSRLVSWYGRTAVWIAGAVTLILIVLGLNMIFGGNDAGTDATADMQKVVTLMPASSAGSGGGVMTVLGTASAVREARLETEAGGRVTSVPVELGQTVRAGTVLATLENSRERAVVLQAQGSYEAAVAGASSGNASVRNAETALDEARISATNAYRSAFTTVDGVVHGTLDTFFSDPNGQIPGVLIDSRGQATVLSEERVAIGNMLEVWSAGTERGDSNLEEAEKNATQVSALLATVATLYAEDKNLQPGLEGQNTALSAARAQLDGALASISGARSNLNQSENALTQARIAGQSGAASASDAQIKQALGSLRLAQANLDKTIVRSPITGTLQSLTLKEGTTVGMGAPAAIVSSEGGLEIVAYVTEDDVRTLAVGAQVSIEETAKGVITQLASAVDPTTKKIEMRVGIEEGADTITNGQSVRITVEGVETTNGSGNSLALPIVALKMTPDGAVVFTVEGGKLVAHTVKLGAIRGDTVVVEEGLDSTWQIVSDARGLRDGEEVEVKQ